MADEKPIDPEPLDIEAIRKRLDAITPPPWRACHGATGSEVCSCGMVWSVSEDVCVSMPDTEGDNQLFSDGVKKNADFIAAAPDDIRALLAEVERLTKALEAYQKFTAPMIPDDINKDLPYDHD